MKAAERKSSRPEGWLPAGAQVPIRLSVKQEAYRRRAQGAPGPGANQGHDDPGPAVAPGGDSCSMAPVSPGPVSGKAETDIQARTRAGRQDSDHRGIGLKYLTTTPIGVNSGKSALQDVI